MNRSATKILAWVLIFCHCNLVVADGYGWAFFPRGDSQPAALESQAFEEPVSIKTAEPSAPPKDALPPEQPSPPRLENLQQEQTVDSRNETLTTVEFKVDVGKGTTKIKPARKAGPKVPLFRLFAAPTRDVITDLVRLDARNHKFDSQTQIFSFDVTLTNISQTVIFTPLKVTIENLRPAPPAVTVVNADGGGNGNGAFWDYSKSVGNDSLLAPGETSAARNWQFRNPQRRQISFLARVEGRINHPPKFTSKPVTRINTGETYLYPAAAIDPDADSLTFALITGPEGMTIIPTEGTIVWNPTPQQLDTQHVEIKVNDPLGGSDTQIFDVAVNRPPVIISTPVTSAEESKPYAYDVEAIDPDGDVVTFALADFPAGMKIDSASGLINWTARIDATSPPQTAAITLAPNIAVNPSSHNFGQVSVGASASQSFIITNAGRIALEVSAINLSGADVDQFKIDGIATPFTLARGDTQRVTISFNPSSLGAKNASLQLVSNDPEKATFNAPLIGNVAGTVCFPNQLDLSLRPGETVTRNVAVTLSSCQIKSTFDNDAEGWVVIGDAQAGSALPTYFSTGGNPGGYVSAKDDVLGGTWYWQAPSKFLGDVSGAYDQTLTFDLRQTFQGSPSQFDEKDVILEGAGLTLVYNTPNNPGANWTSYTVRLNEVAGWKKTLLTGQAPTKAEMLAVLSALAKLQIRGEYRSGPDTGDLDNVTLNCNSYADLPPVADLALKAVDDPNTAFDEKTFIYSINPASFPNVNFNAGGTFNFEVAFACPVGAPRGSSFKLEAQAESPVIIYQNDFETPNVPVVLTCGNVSQQAINSVYGSPRGVFQQAFTVETVIINSPGYSDPAGIAGKYALGMLSSFQDDKLALTFNTQGSQFVNVSLDLSSIDVFCGGGPVGIDNPDLQISLYNSPGGAFSFSNPGTLLARRNATGAKGPNQRTFQWTRNNLTLNASGATDGNVTLVFDLLKSGYAAFDNLVIACSRDLNDVGPSCSSTATVCEVDVGLNCRVGSESRVLVVAQDGRGGMDSQDYSIFVNGNSPPQITSEPNTAAIINAPYRYDVEAQDFDQDSLTFALLTFPAGMTIDPSTGLISWLPTQVGTETVEVQVSDGRGGVDTQTYLIPITIDFPPRVVAMNPPVTNIVPGVQVILNGSFESAAVDPGASFTLLGAGSNAISNWTVGSGDIHYVGTFWNASAGGRSIDLNGLNPGSIRQSFATAIGTEYEVRFDLAGNTAVPPAIKMLRVTAAGFSQDFNFDVTGKSVTNMGWEEKVFTFTANASTTTLTFTSLVSGAFGPAIDNVRVSPLACGTFSSVDKIVLTLSEPVARPTVTDTSFTLEQQGVGRIPPTAIKVDSANNTVTFELASALKEGAYTVTLTDAVRDLGGNRLDGEFAGFFPSGDGKEGGDFKTCFRVSVFGEDTGGPGLVGNVYILAPNTGALPNFCSITPITTILVRNLDVPTRRFDLGFPGLPGLFEWFAIRFSGRIDIATPGSYTFRLTSDDGSRLFIDGRQIINNDGIHAPVTRDGAVTLTKGIHTIVVEYFQGPRFEIALRLFWRPPSQNNFEIVPASVLDRPLSGPNAPAVTAIEPASGVIGQTVKTTVFGANLAQTSSVVFANRSGSPITATVDQVLNDRVDLTLTIPSNTNTGGHAFVFLSPDSALFESGAQGLCFHVQPTPGNLAPIITTDPVLTALVNSEYTYNVDAQDPNNDPLTFSLTTFPAGMTIDPATGLIKWTPVTGQEGNHAVTVQVDDGRGGIATQSFNIQVPITIPNAAPVITSTPLFAAAENELYTYLMTATDADGDFLTFRLLQAPPGMTINTFTGVLQWTPRSGQAGDHEIAVEVSDGKGGRAGQIFTIRVQSSAPTNRPPAIISTPATNATQDKLYVYQVEAVDPDRDPIVFDLTVAPAGMTIDPQTGRIEWTPISAQLGNNKVVVQAEDKQSGGSIQEFTIVVSSGIVNLPPEITSSPSPIANPNVAYSYQVNATDPNSDDLTFALVTFPSGMQINATGLISWTAAQTQLGDHTVEVQVTDGKGGFAQQGYNLRVQETAVTNSAPTITSTPSTNAVEGKPYTYQVAATDPDGDLLSFSLPAAPAGMTINFVTGLVQWTPAATQVGNHDVAVRADDGRGGIVTQRFTISVSAQTINLAPSIISTPPLLASPNTPYKYQVRATDPNQDVLTFALINRPNGMGIDANGLITWAPQNSQLGNHAIELEANDGKGGTAKQSYTLTVAADTLAPVVNIILQPARVNVGKPTGVLVQAVDNVGVTSVSLKVGDTPLTLDSNNRTVFTPAKAGSFVFTATAKDFSGNEGATTAILSVIDPNDVTPPRVAITSPKNGDNVTALTDVIGTVFDQNLLGYSLAYAERKPVFQESDFVEFASGTQNKENTLLGVFDPTLLLNGVYTIRLQAEDINGRRISTFVDVVVSGETKVGNFTLAFTDLSIPVAGLPITITRTYDSRDKQQGDFGFGWRMGIKSVELKEDANRNVTVTLPDGRRVTFNFTVKQQQSFVPIILNAVWEPEPGVNDRLSMIGDNRILFSPLPRPFGEIIGFYARIDIPFRCYEIPGYVLTTADGTRYMIPKPVIRIDPIGFTNCAAAVDLPVYGKPELTEVRDLNGNTLKFTADGIIHSSGKSITFERDGQGRITRIMDPMGNAVTYAYDSRDDLATVTNQVGQVTRFVYSSRIPHHLIKIIDANGREITKLDYDPAGRLARNCDADDNCIAMGHDLVGRRETVFDPTGRLTTYTYDERGNVISLVDGLGNTTIFDYDDNNHLLRMTNSNGGVTEYSYGSRGNLTSVTEPHTSDMPAADFTTRFAYNNRNQLTAIAMPTGAEIRMAYDVAGNLTTLQDEAGNVFFTRTFGPAGLITKEDDSFGSTTFVYDTEGNPVKSTDVFGDVTTMTYDANGQLTNMTEEDGVKSTFEYDGLGRKTTSDYNNGITLAYGYGSGPEWAEVDAPTVGHIERRLTPKGQIEGWMLPDSSEIKYRYDGAGRLMQEVDPLGNVTTYSYDSAGRLEQVTSASGAALEMEYDPAGNMVKQTDALGHSTEFSVMPDGRLATITNARGHTWTQNHTPTTTTIRDPLGRETTFVRSPHGLPVEIVHPDGAKAMASYLGTSRLQDADAYPTQVIDEGGHVRSYTYNSVGQLTTATNLGGAAYQYSYDKSDLVSVKGPTGDKTSFAYDERGNMKSITRPDGNVQTFAYGPNNLPSTVTLASGATITFEYDAAGRELARRSSLGEKTLFSWNAAGALSTVDDATGTTRYTYDVEGELKAIEYPSGARVHYERDLLGQIIEVRMQASPTSKMYVTKYEYDEVGNLKKVVDPLGGETNFVYDAVNRLIERTLPNGLVTSYRYDNRDRITSIEHRKSSGEVLTSTIYERQAVGEPSKIVREDNSFVRLDYDEALRLKCEAFHNASGTLIEKISYTYDAAGNRIARSDDSNDFTYKYEPGSKLDSVTGPSGVVESYTYDPDGRVKSIARDGTTVGLTYDTADRLTAANNQFTGARVEYAYDGIGRRVQAREGASVRKFVVAPTLVEELESPHLMLDEAGEIVAGYVYAGEHPIMRFGPDGAVYYLTDAMGSVISLADENGARVATFEYDGFGNLRTVSGPQAETTSGAGGDFRFHGAWLETGTGLYRFRARDYDPRTARFLSRDLADPDLFEPETLHPYVYANSNPHLYRDPTGMFTIISVSISFNIQNTLQGIRTVALNTVRNIVLDKVGEFVSQLLVRILAAQLSTISPNGFGLASVFEAFKKGPAAAGLEFEKFAAKGICTLFEGSPYVNYVWFEPEVGTRGKPHSDGVNCNSHGSLTFTHRPRPDYILSQNPPKNLNRNGHPKGWLIGDFKLSVRTIYRSYVNPAKQKGQFQAIINFAKHYEFTPITLFVTLYPGKGFQQEAVVGKFVSNGIIPIIVSVF